MVTNTTKVICPKCRGINCYEIKNLQLIDTNLLVSYLCETCETEYTDEYTLVYLGGHMLASRYDRDNIAITADQYTTEQQSKVGFFKST